MSFLQTLDVSASGLYAQRKRMNVISDNLANMETTRTAEGGPYRRKVVVMSSRDMGDSFDAVFNRRLKGVRIDAVVPDTKPFKKVFNPGHPDADEDGYLLKPNVDLVVETTNLLMARRAFEANLTAMKMTKQMALKALEIGR